MHVSPPAGLPRPYGPPPPGMSGNTVFTLTVLIGVVAAALGSLLYLAFAPAPTGSTAAAAPTPTAQAPSPTGEETWEVAPAEPTDPQAPESEPDPSDFSPTLSGEEDDSASLAPLRPQDIKLPSRVGQYELKPQEDLGYYAHTGDYSVITLASYTEDNAQHKRETLRNSGDPYQEYSERFFCYSYKSGASACMFEFPANSGHYVESYSSLDSLEEMHSFTDELLKQAAN